MRRLLGMTIVILFCAVLLYSESRAAESSYSCSVSQGFNFNKNEQDIVGHINYLKIGGVEQTADLTVTDPENISQSKKVACVVSGMYWRGGYSDPVQFTCQVSTNNKNKLSTIVHKPMTNTEVEVDFTIYDYDPKKRKYYKVFHTDKVKLKGLVLKQGGELGMSIDMDEGTEVRSPKNHTFSLGVMPQDQAQQIHIAFSVDNKMKKAWGVSIGR